MSRREPDCEEVIDQLFAYLDRRLDEACSEAIHRHLLRCRECYSRAEFEEKLRERVAGAGMARAPERLQQRVKKLLDDF
jgi:mycothiol system anti-sigma-R factor